MNYATGREVGRLKHANSAYSRHPPKNIGLRDKCLLSSNPNQRFKFSIIYIVSTKLVVESNIVSIQNKAKHYLCIS